MKKNKYKKSKNNLKLLIKIFLILFFLLLFDIFNFKFLTLSKEKFIKGLFVYQPFASYDNDFKPGIELYSKNTKINSFVKGKVILIQDNRINPYNQSSEKTIISISDKNVNYYLKNVMIGSKKDRLDSTDYFNLLNNKFEIFVKKGNFFINPVNIFNFYYFTKVRIVNIYFLNKNNIPVSFRSSYKNNYLKFAIYAYSKIYTPFFIKTINVSNINVYLDNKKIFSQKTDKLDKKLYLLVKTMFLTKYIIAIPPVYAKNGEHTLIIEVLDNDGNSKKIYRKFYVKSD